MNVTRVLVGSFGTGDRSKTSNEGGEVGTTARTFSAWASALEKLDGGEC